MERTLGEVVGDVEGDVMGDAEGEGGGRTPRGAAKYDPAEPRPNSAVGDGVHAGGPRSTKSSVPIAAV